MTFFDDGLKDTETITLATETIELQITRGRVLSHVYNGRMKDGTNIEAWFIGDRWLVRVHPVQGETKQRMCRQLVGALRLALEAL